MQFKKSVVVGVLITLYLSTDSLCHYIPEKDVAQPKKRESETGSVKVRGCGNELTTMIIELCNGTVGSPNQVNFNRESVNNKITEDCCKRACPLDYIYSYCVVSQVFTKKPLKGHASGRLGVGNGSNANGAKKNKKIDKTERHNKINRTWPSIQIGTVSPEIDKFGGQPIVMVKKNRSNLI